ncbi:hypothetical protein M8J75_007808 [Diaphorina citri]|nr:hypothetical protein M8J75_007808 [Diaphorina citri]KAI5746856.1 hypothetical protein M8J77_008198 [Diaphorina citri]
MLSTSHEPWVIELQVQMTSPVTATAYIPNKYCITHHCVDNVHVIAVDIGNSGDIPGSKTNEQKTNGDKRQLSNVNPVIAVLFHRELRRPTSPPVNHFPVHP